jgi:hypothetical protein
VGHAQKLDEQIRADDKVIIVTGANTGTRIIIALHSSAKIIICCGRNWKGDGTRFGETRGHNLYGLS